MERTNRIENMVIVVRLMVLLAIVGIIVFSAVRAHAYSPEVTYGVNDAGNPTLTWPRMENMESLIVQIGEDEPLVLEGIHESMSFVGVGDNNVRLTALTKTGRVPIYNGVLPAK